MPIAHAMFIHGHSIRIEHEKIMEPETRRIGGCFVLVGKPDESNWFHAAIPTTAIVEGRHLRIDSVMLRFQTFGATVKTVHVYDGEKRIDNDKHNDLSLSYDDWNEKKFPIEGKPKVQRGIGISFKVKFGPPGSQRRINVSSAGADFL